MTRELPAPETPTNNNSEDNRQNPNNINVNNDRKVSWNETISFR